MFSLLTDSCKKNVSKILQTVHFDYFKLFSKKQGKEFSKKPIEISWEISGMIILKAWFTYKGR